MKTDATVLIKFNAMPGFGPIIKKGTRVRVTERGGRFSKFEVPGLSTPQELRNDLIEFDGEPVAKFDELEALDA